MPEFDVERIQRLTFRTASPFLLRDVRADTLSEGGLEVDAHLYRPQTGAPFPAVVLSQGLSGVSRSREHRYAGLLAAHGIGALVFDSFLARSRAGAFDPFKALHVTETMLLADAFAALQFLARRPDVVASDIGLLGFSYGGMISVMAAYRQIASLFLPEALRFSRHVAFYGCSIPRLDDPATTGAPVTMLLGAKDRNIDLARTELIAGDLLAGGSPVDLVIYPDLYHQWDDADAGEKLVRLRLADARVTIRRDNSITDDRTGLTVRGWWTRSLVMTLSTGVTGYHVKPDAGATEISDARLLAAFGRRSGSVPNLRHAAAGEASMSGSG